MMMNFIPLLASLGTAFLITYFIMPSIIEMANSKELCAPTNARSSHSNPTPNFGGIGIVSGALLSFLFWGASLGFQELNYFLVAVTIMAMLGVRDDLEAISSSKKLVGQLITASLLVFSGVKLTSLHGIFNIYELPEWIAIGISIFTIIVITNAFNLIDGINGLSAGISIVVFTVLGIWFFQVGEITYSLLCITLIGALLAFLMYNLTPARIFMGDCGSLVIGLIISFLIINFIELHNSIPTHPYASNAAPAIAISILVFPLFDTLRVFTIRILKGRSPLSPDRHHIHHMMIDAGLTHIQASIILATTSLFVIISTITFQNLGTIKLLIFILGFCLLMTLFLRYFVVKRRANFVQDNINIPISHSLKIARKTKERVEVLMVGFVKV